MKILFDLDYYNKKVLGLFMKIALACQSVLLEKSLEIFLKKYIVPYKQCDFVISDKEIEIEKPLFYINSIDESDLPLPFTKSSLILAIERFYAEHILQSEEIKKKGSTLKDLEKKIDILTDNFRKDLIKTIKEYYES